MKTRKSFFVNPFSEILFSRCSRYFEQFFQMPKPLLYLVDERTWKNANLSLNPCFKGVSYIVPNLWLFQDEIRKNLEQSSKFRKGAEIIVKRYM